MSIKTNHTQDSLAPESGVLRIEAKGAVALPSGVEAERPGISAAGYVRFASSVATPEYYDGSTWQLFTSKEYVDSRVGNTGQSLSDIIANLSLNDLTDVTIQGPTDSQLLSYDITLGQFINKSQAMSIVTRLFQGNGEALSFDILTSVGSIQNLVVSINGIQQEPFYSYTLVDGHIVAFDEAPEVGDRIQVKILNSTVSTDRARPRILNISYGAVAQYTTITIVGTDIPYGTGAKIGSTSITRIDYPTEGTMQLMIESNRMSGSEWQSPQELTLVDTSGNEFSFPALINYGSTKPKWTNSNSYIGSYQGGNAIDYELSVQNATSFSISPAYSGESALTWLSVSNGHIVGVAPQNSSPSRYEFTVTATDGSVNITKNFWLLVV